MTNSTPILLTITGPTATGKTALAVAVARALDGEIISADSRQVFRGMDIGTGKDLADYSADGRPVPYHLIDIHDPGYEYNVYQFQNDFIRAFQSIVAAGRQPILCGGTGLYVDAVVRNFPLSHAPVDADFRASVVGFYRKGSDTLDRIDGRKWRIYSWWWMHLRPIRRYLLAAYRYIWLNIFKLK